MGCIKADQALISQIAAHFVAAQLFSQRLYSATALVLTLLLLNYSVKGSTLLLWCCSLLPLLLAQQTSIWQLALCFSVPHTLPCSKLLHCGLLPFTRFCFTSTCSTLLNSALVCSFLLFSFQLYFALLLHTSLVLNASVVAIAQNKETWRSSVLRWLRNFCMINNLSLVLLTFTNSI